MQATNFNHQRRTGARVSSPSSGVRPGARALNLELPTSFGISLFVGVLGLLFGGLFLSHSAYAASYINVSSGSGGAISFGSVRPTSAGTSATASDKLTVNTNCNVGYSVYVSGQNGKDTNLTNSSASSDNVISASSNAIGSAGSLSSNTWGLNSENNGTYVGLPEYSETLPPALVTIPSASETSTVDIYYGLKVNTALTPGTYTGNVLYTVLSNSACSVYTVRFNANGGTGTMADQTINVGEATNLNMNTFTRSGYMFLGWATSSSAATPTYKDGESVADIANFNTTLNLYAVWGKSTGNMQDFVCTNLTSGTTTYLTDARDNQVYSVYHIPTDSVATNVAGKCIMTKDLALGYITSGSIARGQNLILESSTSTAAGTIVARSDASDWDTIRSDDNLQYANGPAEGYEAFSSHSYYSFGAAQKVCPANWRLPIEGEYTDRYGTGGTSTNGIAYITGASVNDIPKLIDSPWHFTMGGYFGSSGFSVTGRYADYWIDRDYSIGYYAPVFAIGYTHGSYWATKGSSEGQSVRCIAQNRYTINYSVNGASGSASKNTEGTLYENNSITTATVGTMSKTGHHFLGWSTDSSATTATYEPGATVSVSTLATATSASDGGTITLYAVWAPNTYTIAYNGNGSTSGSTASQTNQAYGSSVTLQANGFTRTNYTFLGWSTSSSAATSSYSANTSYTISTLASAAGVTNTNNAAITLYAVWQFNGRVCSSTVHPGTTATTACQLADGNMWVYGNNGNTTTWASSYTCPSGYSSPTKSTFDALVNAPSIGGGTLYSVLGLSGNREFWSSTTYNSYNAYYLYVHNPMAGITYIGNNTRNNKAESRYVLCYKSS